MSALPIPSAANEESGQLSPPEIGFLEEANARAKSAAEHARWEQEEADCRAKARRILRLEMGSDTWAEHIDTPFLGPLAAKLYATWKEINVDEPITESEYGRTTALRVDLSTAMALQDRPDAFRDACRILGESIVRSAIQYVIRCHEEDGLAVEEGRRPYYCEDRR